MQSFSENIDRVVDEIADDFHQKITEIKEQIKKKVDDFIVLDSAAATGQADRADGASE